MQHNRVTMLSSSETCHLGSSSNNPAMDQQNLLPNNPTVDEQILLPDTLENENYPHFLLNSHEVGMPNASLIGQQNTSLSLWESAGSSSMGCLVDNGNFLQAKREHFVPSLGIGGPLTIDRRRHEANSSLPSHNLSIDLNVNQADQFGIEDVDVVHGNEQSRTNTASLNRGSTTERIQNHEISLETIGSSSQTADRCDGAAGQEFGALDSHRSSYKRKNIDGNHAETSANGGSRNQYQNNNSLRSALANQGSTSLTMPSTNYADSYPPIDQLNQSTNTSASATLSDHYSLYTGQNESERFIRNTRMRISSHEYDQSPPRLLPEETFRCSAYQPAQQQSSFIPVQPRATSSSASSHNRPHVPAVTQFSQNLHRHPSNGNFGSRIGNSSSSIDTAIRRSISQDPNRSLIRSNVPEPLLLGSSFFKC
uniref:Uncharacterized protein n=1 Tax=Arundo donax TaxID=35708 RepID=A0A0A9ABC2_ARUDO